jgi:hypothetical protein
VRVAQGEFLETSLAGISAASPAGASSLPSARLMLISTLVTALTKTARSGFWIKAVASLPSRSGTESIQRKAWVSRR